VDRVNGSQESACVLFLNFVNLVVLGSIAHHYHKDGQEDMVKSTRRVIKSTVWGTNLVYPL